MSEDNLGRTLLEQAAREYARRHEMPIIVGTVMREGRALTFSGESNEGHQVMFYNRLGDDHETLMLQKPSGQTVLMELYINGTRAYTVLVTEHKGQKGGECTSVDALCAALEGDEKAQLVSLE